MKQRYAVGVDFGGTNIKLGLVAPGRRLVARRTLGSRRLWRPADFIAGVSRAVEELAQGRGIRTRELAGVGVGAPGPVDAARGVVHSLVNVPGWREVPLGQRLARQLGCRCVVENDANLYALGEWRFGAGGRARDAAVLTLGTGLGSGLLLDGRLYRGARGAAGELGHTVLDPAGPRCGCGARGCLEAYVGTAAILRLARSAARRSRGPLRRLCGQAPGGLTPALISEAARQGDPAARGVWAAVGRSLGLGLASLANLLNPERIVIGGGVAKAWPFFAPALRDALRAHALPASWRGLRVVPGRLGDDAGILGAAVLVWENMR